MLMTFCKAVAGLGTERRLLATMLPMAAACSSDTEAGSQAASCCGMCSESPCVLGASIDTTAAVATVGDGMAVVSSSGPPCTSALSNRSREHVSDVRETAVA